MNLKHCFYIIILFCFLFLNLSPQMTFANFKRKNFFKDKTEIKNPFTLRDPFKSVIQDKVTKEKLKKGLLKDGIYTNVLSIDDAPLEDITIIGVIIGKNRRAIARVGESKDSVILKEGMKIGADKAELKAILPGGIVLVEKIENVYGEKEYLETVIPISEEK